MRAVHLMLEHGMSLRNALDYSGCSRKMYYGVPKARTVNLQPDLLRTVEKIALETPGVAHTVSNAGMR